jgi:hypothetical protein
MPLDGIQVWVVKRFDHLTITPFLTPSIQILLGIAV